MSDSASKATRIQWLDIAKGIAMLAIVYGHVFSEVSGTYYDIVYTWIYAWHVPIFAVVTGVIYGSRLNAFHVRKLAHRTRAILVPYISFSVLYMLGSVCLAGETGAWMQDALIKTVKLQGCAALWFLPAFLLAQALVSVIYTAAQTLSETSIFCRCSAVLNKRCGNEPHLVTLILIGCILVPLYLIALQHELAITQYVLWERTVVLAFWLYVGALCYRFFSNLPANIVIILLFGIASVCLSRANGMRELWSANLGNPYLYTAALFTGSCAVIGVSKLIDMLCSPIHPLHRALSFVGAESLMVMGVHQLGLAIVAHHINASSVPFALYLLCDVLSMVAVVGVVYAMSKRWPLFFGKKRG